MFRKRTHYIYEEKTDQGAGQLESSMRNNKLRYIWNSVNWIMSSLLNLMVLIKINLYYNCDKWSINFLLLQKLMIKREFWKKEVNSPVILPPKYQSHHSGMMLLDSPPNPPTPAGKMHFCSWLSPSRAHGFSVYFSLLWQTSFHIATYQESRIVITAKQPTKWIHLH